MTQIDNKFEVGEKVYVVARDYSGDGCDLCKGTKKVEAYGYEIKCPKCKGDKNYNKEFIHIPVIGTIHLIKISYTNSETENENVLKIRYSVHFDDELEKRYPADLAEQNIFKTIEECKEFCKMRNNQFKK